LSVIEIYRQLERRSKVTSHVAVLAACW